MAGAEPGRGHGPQAAPSSPPHPRLPTDLSAPEPEGQSPQGGAWLPGSLGPALDSPTSPGSSLPGERGGTCTGPGQEGKVTHTKLSNQQRRILAAPAPPGCPTPRVQSLRPEPNTLLGQKRGGLPPRRSLSAPSVAASWTVGGGHGRRASASCPPRRGCNCGVLLPRPRPGPGHHSPPSPRAG